MDARTLLAVLLVAPLAGCSEPSSRGLAEVVDEARRLAGAPGAIVGVRYPDGSTEIVASGLSNLETGRAMHARDAFFLGSVTKTYTAVLVMRLAEEGRLGIEDSIGRFVPGFPRGDEITIRQLLQHTSGLSDFYLYLYLRPDRKEMIENVTRTWTQEEMLELAARFGHSFDPGTDWSYSNTNYFLLGVVAERAAGMSLAKAYRRYLLDPLDLDGTWLTLYEEARGSLPITGYLGFVEGWEHSEMFGTLGPTDRIERSNLEWGAGGLAAPVAEALSFLGALFAGELLAAESLRQMMSFLSTESLGAEAEGVLPDEESGYGLGLIRMKRAGYEAVGHGGLFAGHTAGLWYLPQSRMTVVLFLNRGFVGQRRVLDRVVREITGPR